MRRLYYLLSISTALFLCAPFANAQRAFDLNLGFGTANTSANSGGLDNANSTNAFGSCAIGSGDPDCQGLPKLNGFFLGFGGDVMLYKYFGVGAEMAVQPALSNYGPLQYRQSFYDFNGIFQPVSRKRVSVQLQGGIGGARTSFTYSQSSCVGTAVCTNQAEPVGNASHFQVHLGAGVQIFLTNHIFVKPEFDFHYVPNLTQQFGSNAVPAAMVWLGYSFGDRS